MKAIIVKAPGNDDDLHLVDIRVSDPEPAEVRIRIVAAGFNPADDKMRRTLSADGVPVILGGEAAGVVDAVGASVYDLQIGDAVCAYLPLKRGGYAESVCSPAAFVARKPDQLSFSEAAAVPLAGLTALACVGERQVLSDTALFVAGASGGVGSFTIQLLRVAGASPVIATAGSAESAAYLTQSLGLHEKQIVRYDGVDDKHLSNCVRALNEGELFPRAIDLVGGRMSRICCEVIDFDGYVTSIVQRPHEEDQQRLFDKSAGFRFVSLRARAKFGPQSTWTKYRTSLSTLLDLIVQGQIRLPQITNVGALSVETVRVAHRLLQSGHVQGKLVMTI
jgi:NADPH2:quinone reductase